jgi:rod shape determining protein RodA
MYELKKGNSFDLSVFISALLLWILGILVVFSATHIHQTGPLVGIYKSQILWVCMALLIIAIIMSVPTRLYYSFSYYFYAGSLLMLLAVDLTGGEIAKGAGRWISIGGFKIQPSEFAKIGLMLALARYLANNTISLQRFSTFIVPAILIIVPFGLVLKQPDLGTAMVFCATALPMFFWAGMPLLELFYLISPGLSAMLSAIPLILAFSKAEVAGIGSAIPWGLFFITLCAVLYFARPPIIIAAILVFANLFTATITTVLWNSLLRDYQKMRIISFIDPQQDATGAGYQVIQSMVAIGSGHIFGKGYLKGTQTRLSYLPEQHTDFIFSVLGEQFGLIGCTLTLGLLLFLIIRGYQLTQHSRNRFTNLVIVGSVSIIAFHICINVAMTLGMMPVVGVPLPFLSYGGSFTLTLAILIGFLINSKMSNQNF